MTRCSAVLLALLLLSGGRPGNGLAQGTGNGSDPAAATDDITAYVDPIIGTGGEGHVFPGATLPFGMVQLGPSSDRDSWSWSSGYHYSGKDIEGFAHTHLSGAGMAALGDILLMPARTNATEPGEPDRPGSGYRSRFSHANEHAEPGYYRVHLDDPDVDAELTTTLRTGFHRYTFLGGADRFVIIDPTHGVGEHTYQSGVEIVSDREIRGFRRSISQPSGDRAVYFVARFSQPFLRSGLTDEGRAVAGPKRSGRSIRAFVEFPPGSANRVEVAVAISHTGYRGALANYDAEARGRAFDEIRAQAHEIWRRQLSRIAVADESVTKKRLFYTAEYHAAIAPNLISDVTGDYYADGKVRHSRIPQFSNFSNWDTYRALHPLLTIIDPGKSGEIVASMVSRFADEHIALPIWEAVGHDSRVMIGYSIVSPIADAVLKGIPGVDANAAYAAMRAIAFDRSKHSNVYDANGMDGYLTYGFVPADVASSVSKTTEQNYEDWVIGRVAAKLGKKADAALFATRAIGYRQLYDPATGFLVPRLADGRFVRFGANDWDELNRHYVSGNIWAYSAYTPQDMVGAIRLHGGRDAYARWLDGIFTDNRPIAGKQHVDLSGFIGRYGHGDEPGHEMAYLFDLAGQPWKTQSYVNRVIREMYADRPDGFVNNEDLGQMSAWYIFSTLGFYPVTPGEPTYQLGAPYYRRASIALGGGKSFVVEADNLSPRNIYIQSANLDGQPYNRSYLTHEAIMAGGLLRFVMGPAPNRAWGSAPADTSLGQFDDRAGQEIPHLAPWGPYDTDPSSYFASSRTVRLATKEPRSRIFYTLDGTEPVRASKAYNSPITIKRDTLLKAAVFDSAGRRSTIFEKRYLRTATAGLRPGYPAIRIEQSDMPYGEADGSMLIDQVRGTRFYGDRKWTGRLGEISAIIDLGQKRSVRSVSVGFLDDPMNGILPPGRLDVLAGDDPSNLRMLGSRSLAGSAAIRQQPGELALPLGGRGRAFRYYRIKVTSAGDMPASLSKPGRRAWLFLDEILLR